MIGERQHNHRVAADQSCGHQALRRGDLRAFNDRRIPALRQIDDDLIFLPLLGIVSGQTCTQTPCLDANDRIGSRVEAGVFAKDLHPDQKLFQMGAPAGNGFFHDEADKALETVGLMEGAAGQNAVQLKSGLLVSLRY